MESETRGWPPGGNSRAGLSLPGSFVHPHPLSISARLVVFVLGFFPATASELSPRPVRGWIRAGKSSRASRWKRWAPSRSFRRRKGGWETAVESICGDKSVPVRRPRDFCGGRQTGRYAGGWVAKGPGCNAVIRCVQRQCSSSPLVQSSATSTP